MPQRFIPHVLRAVIFGKTNFLTDELNVLHFTTPETVIDSGLCLSLATAIDAWSASNYQVCFSEQVRYIGTHVRGMDALITGQATVVTNQHAGQIAGDPLPLTTSLPVLLLTGQTGHGSHGMFHVFTPGEANNDTDGNPTLAYIGVVADALEALASTTRDAGFDLVVASFRYGTVKSVVATQVRNFWGTVNSRKLEHGR